MQLTVNQRLLAIMGGAVLALLITGLIGFLSSQKISDELKFTDENIIRSLAILSSGRLMRRFLGRIIVGEVVERVDAHQQKIALGAR